MNDKELKTEVLRESLAIVSRIGLDGSQTREIHLRNWIGALCLRQRAEEARSGCEAMQRGADQARKDSGYTVAGVLVALADRFRRQAERLERLAKEMEQAESASLPG